MSSAEIDELEADADVDAEYVVSLLAGADAADGNEEEEGEGICVRSTLSAFRSRCKISLL